MRRRAPVRRAGRDVAAPRQRERLAGTALRARGRSRQRDRRGEQAGHRHCSSRRCHRASCTPLPFAGQTAPRGPTDIRIAAVARRARDLTRLVIAMTIAALSMGGAPGGRADARGSLHALRRRRLAARWPARDTGVRRLLQHRLVPGRRARRVPLRPGRASSTTRATWTWRPATRNAPWSCASMTPWSPNVLRLRVSGPARPPVRSTRRRPAVGAAARVGAALRARRGRRTDRPRASHELHLRSALSVWQPGSRATHLAHPPGGHAGRCGVAQGGDRGRLAISPTCTACSGS